MLSKIALFLALVFAVAATALALPYPPATCSDVAKFTSCARAFGREMNLEISEDATQLAEQMGKQYEHGLLSYSKLCSAMDSLSSCVGSESVLRACIAPDFLTGTLHLNTVSATVYHSLAGSFLVQCSAEYRPVMEQNEKCFMKVTSTKKSELQQCANVMTDSPAGDTCTNINKMLRCQTSVYKECGPQFQQAMCEMAKKETNELLDQIHCQIQC